MFLLLNFRCSLWWFLTMLTWLLPILLVIPASSENIRNTSSCIERERQALLSFKSGLIENADLLSSWRCDDKDCCRWIGVHCSHKTGHITALDLSPKVKKQIDDKGYGLNLGGEIGPSLLNLTYLHYLDLSYNNFSRFPVFIGLLNGLRYLNLSYSCSDTILPQLGNLSKLESLDIGSSYVTIDPLEWISRLSSLTYLRMNNLNLSSFPNSFESIMNLPSLVSLSFEYCVISIPPFPSNFNSSKFLEVIHMTGYRSHLPIASFKWLNVSHKLVDLTLSRLFDIHYSIWDFVGTMTSLEHLDLSGNDLEGHIPMSLGNLCKLQTLDLTYNICLNGTLNFFQNWTRCPQDCVLREFRAANNQLSGPLDFTKFTSLEVLDVSGNLLNGSLSDGISKLSNLTVLDISHNRFNGVLPRNIWKLSNLIILDVHSNFLEGVISDSDISDSDISNLHRLKSLDLSFNSFKLNFSSNWVPPFQLNHLWLSGFELGPAFPNWIRTQENLAELDISDSGISDVLPSWFLDMCDRLIYFNISHNNVRGKSPNFSSETLSAKLIDLSSNRFDGPLPRFSSDTIILNVSKNKFSGNISFLCTQGQGFGNLGLLDLSSNLLSGHLPDCWMNYEYLLLLDLSNNDFRGTIPRSIGALSNLISLRLSNNSLSGKLPSSFNGKALTMLDLGENQLFGNIPTWIGNSTSLVILKLQSNRFWGSIPNSLCQMTDIHILDLSLNNLSGTIPTCLNNLTIMAQKTSELMDKTIWLFSLSSEKNGNEGYYFANTWVTWKGTKAEFEKTLGLLKYIDLSSNKLSGEIPAQLASLYGLTLLNLSSNKLTGPIPSMIGQLQQLDSLDLSNNQLSDKIPESIINIFGLSYLNLSNNKLFGRIPTSTQMQSFDTAFAGNPGLCGLPLATKCPGDGNLHPPPITYHGSADDSNQEDEEWFKSRWFYGIVALGYVIGFWGVCGPLVVYASFRQAYFQFLNRVKDSVLLAIALKRAKLKRWLQP